jgi:anaerobic selenocysteine-containing dehydrogenase
MIHPADAEPLGIAAGDWVRLKNHRGDVFLRARLFDGVRRGVLIAEGIWPNAAHPHGRGINTLTGADQVAPYGGAAFHDIRVALERADPDPGAVAALPALAVGARTEPAAAEA